MGGWLLLWVTWPSKLLLWVTQSHTRVPKVVDPRRLAAWRLRIGTLLEN